MNDERIAELRKLCEAATPGPWRTEVRPGSAVVWIMAPNTITATVADASSLEDGMFIAAADPTAIAQLLAERRELVELAAAVARWAKHDEDNPLPAYRHDAELLEAYEAYKSRLDPSAEGRK